MSVILNFKLLDSSKLDLITSVLNKSFSVAKFEIGDFGICSAVILTNKSYLEIKNIFEQSLCMENNLVEFIIHRRYFE